MENRDYLRKFGEDCDSDVDCKDCKVKEQCRTEIEETHGVIFDKEAEE